MRHLQARLLFVFVLTITITNCKKSGSSSSEPAKPASTATPAQPVAATDTQKPSTGPAPMKKFELKEGAFFPADQIPTNGRSEFVLQGQPGKFLRVEVEEDPGKSARAAKLTAESVTG